MNHQIRGVFESQLMYNATSVERYLQQQLNHHDLGLRTWRAPGMGKKDDGILGKAHYVSLTYCLLDPTDPVIIEPYTSKTGFSGVKGVSKDRVVAIRTEGGKVLRVNF